MSSHPVSDPVEPPWLEWAKRLQSLAQMGLAYTDDMYDELRYAEIRQIAVEIAAEGSNTNPEIVADLFASDIGPSTPKVAVQAAIFDDGRLLMVRERSDGKWTLPGGWADLYESPSEAVVREVFEESGFHTEAVKLIAAFDRSKHPHSPSPDHVYKLVFACRIVGGEARTSMETDAVEFFAEDELPELSIARVTTSQLAHVFAYHVDTERPTHFD